MALDPSALALVPVPAWLDRAAYPFAHHWATLPAGRMHYLDEGHGEPILFVHGTPTWSFEFRHLVRALSVTHRCIAPDHLGFGLSERPDAFGYRPEDHAANLEAFVERLQLDRFTLVVHDFGGPIGLPLALQRPGRVRRVVILNSWMWSFDDDRDMQRKARFASGGFGRWLYRWANASLRLLMPSVYGDRRKLTRDIHRQYLSVFPDRNGREQVLWALARALLGSRDFYHSLWQQRDRLRQLPMLIAWGLEDSAFQPHQLARWTEAFPHAAVLRLASAGHWPHEEEPDAVLTAMRAWFARQEERGTRAATAASSPG
jgi:haloalkane dehalogenase